MKDASSPVRRRGCAVEMQLDGSDTWDATIWILPRETLEDALRSAAEQARALCLRYQALGATVTVRGRGDEHAECRVRID